MHHLRLLTGTLCLVAALVGNAAAAGAQQVAPEVKYYSGEPIGKVCLQLDGWFIANARFLAYGFFGQRWAWQKDNTLFLGQRACHDFDGEVSAVRVMAQASGGQTKECEINVRNRPGEHVAKMWGTTLDVTLQCP